MVYIEAPWCAGAVFVLEIISINHILVCFISVSLQELNNMILASIKLESKYSHFIDASIVNEDLKTSVTQLVAISMVMRVPPRSDPLSRVVSNANPRVARTLGMGE